MTAHRDSPGWLHLKAVQRIWLDRLASAWVVVVLVLCWLPRRMLPEGETTSHIRIPHLDKAIHFSMFFLISTLWLWGRPTRTRLLWVLIGGLALAVVSELGQDLPMIGREASVLDGLADLMGLAVGAGLACLIDRPGREPR
ncbi:MAG: VanZ family protein [Isosphaeraceae bacterium]